MYNILKFHEQKYDFKVVFGYLNLDFKSMDLNLDFKSMDLNSLDSKSINFKIPYLDVFYSLLLRGF